MAKVLYIDSSREQFEKLRAAMSDLDDPVEVSWAGSAVPAQMILERGAFDGVISAYMLSDLDGLTLLQRLRQNGRNLPFVLLTGQKNRQIEEKALKLGADAVFQKSEVLADASLLENALKEALESRNGTTIIDADVEDLQRQAAFFQINPAPVLAARYSGIIVSHNIAAREIFAQPLKGRQLTELFSGLNLYDIKIIANYGVSQIEQKIGDDTFLFTFRSDLDEKLLYVFGSNISDRIQAEGELRKAHGENELLLASISSILISVDKRGYIRQFNKVAEDDFGLKAEDVIGKPFKDCGIQWRDERMQKNTGRFQEAGEPVRMESVRFRKPDGSDSFLSLTISPILVGSGQTSGFLLLADDITERKVLEDQLSQAQKLEAIGQLAAGIAHEINTPTQYIGDNTHFLNDSFKDLITLLQKVQSLSNASAVNADVSELVKEVQRAAEDADLEYLIEEVPTAIEQSLEGINRVTDIVRSMKDFSHPGTEEKTEIDIAKALQSTITVCRNVWKYVAEVETDFDPDLPPVPCFPGELNQVFLNIITNGAHAIGDIVGDGTEGKGTIHVATRRHGDKARILLGDTGGGIPEKIQKRIFEPFFTTKEVGKGTGQGLAISHAVIVDKHGGEISFKTEKGKGTTFIIDLPLQDPAAIEGGEQD